MAVLKENADGTGRSLPEIIVEEALLISPSIKPSALEDLQIFFDRLKSLKSSGPSDAAFLLQQLFRSPSANLDILQNSGRLIFDIWKQKNDLRSKVSKIVSVIRDVNLHFYPKPEATAAMLVSQAAAASIRAMKVERSSRVVTSYTGYDDGDGPLEPNP